MFNLSVQHNTSQRHEVEQTLVEMSEELQTKLFFITSCVCNLAVKIKTKSSFEFKFNNCYLPEMCS